MAAPTPPQAPQDPLLQPPSRLQRQWDALWSWWEAKSPQDQLRTILVAVAVLGLMVHQCILWNWYVEDAAISFAYARNLIHGEGLVAYPGSERLEGYSNPTWVAILAVMQLLRLDPFTFVKPLELAIGVATVPALYFTVREAVGPKSDVPLVAVGFLAVNSQFAIWGGCGLENGLLNLLVALGFWRTMVELRPSESRRPWSALLWLGVALTRPEGILYAAVAGFCTMVYQLHARRGLGSTIGWLALFFVPWTAYQAAHLWYFAWPFANTYYAKLSDRFEPRMVWDKKAWNWTRNFFNDVGHGFFLPIWILGVLGDGRVRWALATVVFLVAGLTIELSHDQRWLLPVVVATVWAGFWLGLRATEEHPPKALIAGGTALALIVLAASEGARKWLGFHPNLLPMPEWTHVVPPYVFIVLALVLPVVGYGARGWQLRTMSWLFCVAVTFFAVYVEWDWMKGFRWYAVGAVPGAILFGFGVDSFVRWVEEMFELRGWKESDEPAWRTWGPVGAVLAFVLVLLQLPGNVDSTWTVAANPDPSPAGILPRIRHVEQLQRRLHIEDPVVDLDVDQGAHLWWSDFQMMDVAGLIDLPIAHHKFDRGFIREYVFEERKPHYAHIHGQWASNSRLPTHTEWREQYVEVPGYPAGKSQLHIGSYLRRDLFTAPAWPYAEPGIALEGGVTLYPPHVPSEPAANRKMYVEVGVSSSGLRKGKAADFRLVLFATDGEHLASWDLPPGYDWLPPQRWSPEEVFVGKFDVTLRGMPPGTYDLGLIVIGADGTPLARLEPGDPTPTPVLSPAEVVFPGVVKVLSLDDRATAAAADRDDAIAKAGALDCDGAEHAWWLARKHRPDDQPWADEHHDAVARAFSSCWARSADGQPREEQVRRLVKARTWDWWDPEYTSRATPLADALYAEGMSERAAKDWESAYRSFSDCVAVEPTRSWARKYAEEARGYRLGIDEDTLAQKRVAEAAEKAAAEDKRKAATKAKAKAPAPPRQGK